MKKLSNEQSKKINQYRKQQKDISELIKGYDIRGLDLSNSIIKTFNRICDNISNVNFSYAIIGEDKKETNLGSSIVNNCNFRGTVFKGLVLARKTDFRYSTFVYAQVPNAEYQGADLRHCTFCNTVIALGTNVGARAKIDKTLIWQLMRVYETDFELEYKPKKPKEEDKK